MEAYSSQPLSPQLSTLPQAAANPHQLLSWSIATRAAGPLLAVGHASGVAVQTAEGAPAASGGSVQRSTPGVPACIAWHPQHLLLAVGWADGPVSLWDAAHGRHIEVGRQDDSKHSPAAAPTQLIWHPSGQHLLTTDAHGKVALLALDVQQQRLQPLRNACEQGGNITHAVWWDSPAGTTPPPRCSAAVFATSTPGSGTVSLKSLDVQGRVSVIKDIGESLVGLLLYAERGQVVAVTASGDVVVLAPSGTTDGGARRHSSSSSSSSCPACPEWDVLLRIKVANTAAAGAGLQVCWAGPHCLALGSSQDANVRMLQLDTDDSFVLETPDSSVQACAAGVSALAYQADEHVLAVAAGAGRVHLFQHCWPRDAGAAARASSKTAAADTARLSWQLMHTVEVGPGATPACVHWGPSVGVLAVSCTNGKHHVVRRIALHHKVAGGCAAVQVAAGHVVVQQMDGSTAPIAVTTSLQLAGLDVAADGSLLLLHDGKRAEVHSISTASSGSSSLTARMESAWPLSDAAAAAADDDSSCCVAAGPGHGCSMVLLGDTVCRTAEGCVEVCDPTTGGVRQTLVFDAAQGQPVLLDAHGSHLAVLTSRDLVRVFGAQGQDVKPQAGPGRLLSGDALPTGLRIEAIRVNSDGSMVCALARCDAEHPSTSRSNARLFVYSAGANGPLSSLDWSSDGLMPQAAAWDVTDARLLAVQTSPLCMCNSSSGSTACARWPDSSGAQQQQQQQQQPLSTATAAAGAEDVPQPSHVQACCSGGEMGILFVSDEVGMLLHENQSLPASLAGLGGGSALVGVAAPHVLFVTAAAVAAARNLQDARTGSSALGGLVALVPLCCFGDLDAAGSADGALCAALLDFNYLLAAGRPEKAFAAVSTLMSGRGSADMAHSMARAAIKSKRLDVAEQCLGRMEHVRGARALREGACEPELDARVGLVAVQLGLPDDAARLFGGCGRWDLLQQLHTAGGRWDAALQVASEQDRVRQAAVQHAHARHCEAIGDLHSAAQHFAAAGSPTDVARMLWEAGETDALQQHLAGSSDPAVLGWWARSCEAQGQYQQAVGCYQRAGNQLAVLRIHCAMGNWAAAEQLVASTQDPAAAFHLARLYEAQDRVPDALRCYAISKRPAHAARLAKRCNMDGELLSFALQGPLPLMLEAADHLLAAGNVQGAALLFLQAGRLGKALEMAAGLGGGPALGGVLDAIAARLDADAEPELLSRCADSLLAAGRHDQAVQLLVKGRQQERALELLLAHEVPLTEALADALTPDKLQGNGDHRSAVLIRIAQAAKAQGLWHLACKKYTQAGDRLAAVRALVKSGDTDKIVFFAGASRQREVYVAAANYLQTLNWRAQPQLLATITALYAKAGAHDSLATFFLGCGQAEVHEFQAYDRALQAMREAAGHLARAQAMPDREALLAALTAATERVAHFVHAQAQLQHDPAATVQLCQQLFQELTQQQQQQLHDVTTGMPDVRLGDVYALLMRWCCGQGNMQQALQLAGQMLQDHRLQPRHYLDAETLAAVQQADTAGLLQRAAATGKCNAGVAGRAAGAAGTALDEEEQLPYMADDDSGAGG